MQKETNNIFTRDSMHMDPKYGEHSTLIRWCGLAAVLAGLLRGVGSFVPATASFWLQLFYLLIDLLFFFAVIGWYAYQKQETGWWGFTGFLLALIGAGLLIVNDVVNAFTNLFLYPLAATLFAVGVSVLAIVSWSVNSIPRWACALLIVSTLVGFLGYFSRGFAILFVLSGVMFGVGFIGVGLKLWMQSTGVGSSHAVFRSLWKQ
jgi:hypothetical protein